MYEYIVSEALKRREVHDNLWKYLEMFKRVVLEVDPNAEIYLFGSVAEGVWNYSSDIDILIITVKDKLKILEALAKEDYMKFFDVHIRSPTEASWYKIMTKLVRI